MQEFHVDGERLDQYGEEGYVAFGELMLADEVAASREALAGVMKQMLLDAKAGRAEYVPPKLGQTGNYDGAWVKRPGTKTALLFEHSFDPMAVDEDVALNRVRNIY